MCPKQKCTEKEELVENMVTRSVDALFADVPFEAKRAEAFAEVPFEVKPRDDEPAPYIHSCRHGKLTGASTFDF